MSATILRSPDDKASDETQGEVQPSDTELANAAVALARDVLAASLSDESRRERRRRERLGRLLDDAHGRELILTLTDEVLRLDAPRVAARRFSELVSVHRTNAMGVVDRALLSLGAVLAPRLPRLVMPLVVRRVRAETRGIVLPADDPQFARHLARRERDGVGLNVNPLGEAILSDAEADARMSVVLAKIGRPDVDYVSVKISAIVANLDVLAFDHTVGRIVERLRVLFRAAAATTPRTFVNLDMEEFRDLDLTIDAFTSVLDEPEFASTDAGIVLQAYLPDAHAAADHLGAWAAERYRRHGGHLKVRLVKGANLAMESVEAELHGWTPAPYGAKADVDASYKRLLDSLLRPEWRDAVRVGVASHNLFDITWALVRADALGALGRIEFEMLEGMAPAQARAVQRLLRARGAGSLLMYSPVVADEDFDASIAYLSRRLDENTQADNFLKSLFTLTVDSAEFARQEQRFRAAVEAHESISTVHRRGPLARSGDAFGNEPESDFTRPGVRAAVAEALSTVQLVNPTRVETGDEIDGIVEMAAAAVDPLPDLGRRREWLVAVADQMRSSRFETMALMAAETGKTVHQADPEIAEAIDFCDYYGRVGVDGLESLASNGYDVSPRGVVAVVAPWNFPFAIPTGGVAAALAAGNSVILKPAPEAVHVGAHLAEQFWAAGVPRDVLQLVVCDDGPVASQLVTHRGIDSVTLTGSFETASMFLDWRPGLRVLAETSGKNSLVVTAAADIDLAIADLVNSAFGHAGQKCSAASLVIVDASVHDDGVFLRRLRDAVRSLPVGRPDDLSSIVGPIIAEPTGALKRALTTLEPGERWLVEPKLLDERAQLWSPGVRTGVEPGSWFHRTECFGPVLGVMRAENLADAIELQNATDYGLTGGIHSLDPSEIAMWLERVEVGNAYVNRGTTGAIVQRQPFGGWKRSSVGGSAKAGGPGYVQQFARISDASVDGRVDVQRVIERARTSYREAWSTYFTRPHDPSGLAAESNVLRHVPLQQVAVRHDGGDHLAIELLRLAARTAGIQLVESSADDEAESDFEMRLRGVDRLRLLTHVSDGVRRHCHELNIPVDDSLPVSDGFVELHRWVREQSVSRTTHRHGRLVAAP